MVSTVLVSEDSRTQREIIAHLLSQMGLRIIEASDGLEAWDKIQTDSPDLVVADIICPGMDGYELCNRLKSNPQTHHIPVIFCTSKTEEADRYWGMKQGATDYICKPFQPPELMETVVAHLLQQGKICQHPDPADEWTEVGLIWLEDYQNQDWAIAAFDKALQINPDHDLAKRCRDAALGKLEPVRTCETCGYYYGGSPGGNLLVCAIHPSGTIDEHCRDWESKYR